MGTCLMYGVVGSNFKEDILVRVLPCFVLPSCDSFVANQLLNKIQ